MLIAFGSPRRGELEAMQWEHVDLARGVMRIPRGKTLGRPIAIHPMLRPWLEAMHAGIGPILEPWANVGRDLLAAVERTNAAAAAAAAERGVPPPPPIPRVTPNDLRRTFASWLVQAGESLYVVFRLLGHSSTRMVERVYGQLDEATLASVIGRLPGACDAGVIHAGARGGTPGAGGMSVSAPAIVNSVEESANSAGFVVPRVGIEPTTRGFSVRCSTN
jgi:integrase